MGLRREIFAFGAVLAACVAGLFHETLFCGKVLSPADNLLVSASFRGEGPGDYEPANRLLMDPVLQFQPWFEFNRRMIRSGRLPLWNGHAGCGAPHLANGQSAVFDPFHLLAYLGPTPQAYAWIAAARLWMAGLGMYLLGRAWGLALWGRWFTGLVYPFCGFLVLWLLFPVTAVAIWMPWLFLATDRVFRAPGLRGAGWLAVVVALIVFGGHIQTSAHVLLAGWTLHTRQAILGTSRPAQGASRHDVLGDGNLPGLGAGGGSDFAAWVLSCQELCLERPKERAAALVDDRSATITRRRVHGGALSLWEPAQGTSQLGSSPWCPQSE